LTESEQQFAKEIIEYYGEDRFYHSAIWNSTRETARRFFIGLNPNGNWEAREKELGLHLVQKNIEIETNNLHYELCRIVFSICKRYKEFGLKSKNPPDNIHARIMFSEKNKWTALYAELMEEI
jgi:hypothetical protein